MTTITDTTQRALLNAIIANPDDNAPRLIFADWLDENAVESECEKCDGTATHHISYYAHEACPSCNANGRVSNGFAERAASIRCQIKHPRWFGDDTWMESDNKNEDGYLDALSWLKSDHCKTEFANTQEGNWVWNKMRPDGIVGVYRRGFIDEIRCTLKQWLDHGKDIVREHPATKVVATDKEPRAMGTHKLPVVSWWTTNPTGRPLLEYDSTYIQRDVFDFLIGKLQFVELRKDVWKNYSDAEQAHAALSSALLAWAKS